MPLLQLCIFTKNLRCQATLERLWWESSLPIPSYKESTCYQAGWIIHHKLPYAVPSGSTLLLLETSNKLYKELWIQVLSVFVSCLLQLGSISIYIRRRRDKWCDLDTWLILEKVLKLLNPGNERARLNVSSD